jgi:hypothetical protein
MIYLEEVSQKKIRSSPSKKKIGYVKSEKKPYIILNIMVQRKS